jgi:hypothetical protein
MVLMVSPQENCGNDKFSFKKNPFYTTEQDCKMDLFGN